MGHYCVLILSYKAGKGRTLIEKFEQEAQNASFAFALFTPDDFKKIGETAVYEARPNVIFELGWFYGNYGRENVCILFKVGTSIPSDLEGISKVQFKETVDEKILEIGKELKAAGIIN